MAVINRNGLSISDTVRPSATVKKMEGTPA
jgi:hypothetical protein